MSVSRPPLLLFIVPGLALMVALASIFLGSDDQPYLAAKVLGGPTDGEEFHGRVLVVEEGAFVVVPAPGRDIVIRARQGAHEVTRSLRTGPDGWVEFSFARLREEPLELSVVAGEQVLASGRAELSTSRWQSTATQRSATLGPIHEGDISADLTVQSGVLGVPFSGPMILRVKERGQPAAHMKFSLSGESLQIVGSTSGELDAMGKASFAVIPTHHVATLKVTLLRDEEPLSFERTLPVLPGSLSMKRTEAGILVKSPVEREAIWYTFVTKSRRLQGGRLALQLEDDVWQGRIEAERVPRVQGLYVVLSSEADGRSASTVGFPLDGQEQTYEVWDAYLIDGLPQVRAREVAQRTRFRLVLGAYAAVCGVLSMIIFWIQVRRSDVELATSLRRAGAAAATQNRNALPLLIAVLCLFFAFSATVLWIVAR